MKMNYRLTVPEPSSIRQIPLISDSASVLSKEECQTIINLMQDHERLEVGKVGHGNGKYIVDTGHRVVRSADILEADAPWLYEKVVEVIHRFNKEFQFDLYGLLDDIIFMRYDEPTGDLPAGHFNWHPDAGAGYTAMRKFSIVIGLSEEADYEGGELEYFHGGTQQYGKTPQGTAIAFPAYINHRVLPITKGRRCSLVIFVIGPRFR